ncbi:MAG: ATP-binding protein [Patescibacteria group bacterium]|jgi:signal transduction histidine kinase
MNLYAISGLFNALAATILGFAILLHNTSRKINRLFFIFTLSISVWSYAYFFWQIASSAPMALLWTRLLMAGAIFIPFTYLHYLVVYVNQWKQKSKLVIIGYGIAILFLFTDFTPYFVESVSQKLSFPFWPNPGILFHPFLIIWIACVIYTLYLNLKAISHAKGVFRSQLLYMFWGLVIGYLGGGTNFLLWYNIPTPPIGNVFITVFVCFVAYAIARYRLFDVQIQLQKIINFLLPIVISITLSTVFAYALYTYTKLDYALNGVIILLFYTVVYSILHYVFFYTPVSYLLFYRTYRAHRAIKELANKATTIIDLAALTNEIIVTLTEKLLVEKVAIFIREEFNSKAFNLAQQKNFNEQNVQALVSLSAEQLLAFQQPQPSYVADELDMVLQQNNLFPDHRQRQQTIYDLLQASQATVILPLRAQQSLMGFIVLGDKYPRKAYTKDDLELLEQVCKEIAVALINSKLHQDQTVLTRILQEEVDRATVKWRQKAKENEELLRVKTQFITVASHQLRTPLSVIRGMLGMMFEDYLIKKEQDTLETVQQRMLDANKMLHHAFAAADNLHHTMEMILAASEFTGGSSEVIIDKIDARAFFTEQANSIQHLLQTDSKQALKFYLTLDRKLPEVLRQDKQKLNIILQVLLTNAIIYTVKGSISLTVEDHNQACVITVTDTGIGIPANLQHKIFDQFVRLDNAKKMVADGSGLGLYLAKQYAELLHGSMTFESETGKGSAFTVRIPWEYQYM